MSALAAEEHKQGQRSSGRWSDDDLLYRRWGSGLGALMFELQHFTDGVNFLVEWDTAHHARRLRGVVYDRPETAQHATQLATSLKVPLMAAGDLPDRPQTATLHLP
jgi:hypothetical protein